MDPSPSVSVPWINFQVCEELEFINHATDKLQFTGLNLGRSFNSRSGWMNVIHLLYRIAKLPSLKLKTGTEQLLGFFPLTFVLPEAVFLVVCDPSMNEL